MKDGFNLKKTHSESSGQAYSTILSGWQRGVFKVNAYIIVITFLIEIVFMFLLDAAGTISVPIPRYIPLYILRPTLINVVAYLTAWLLHRNENVSQGVRDMIPLVLFTVIISNLIVVHFVFTAVYAAIIIPIYMSAIYGDVTITRRIHILLHPVYFFDILCIVLMSFDRLPDAFAYDVVVAYVMIPLSYILVKNSVEYENKKEQLIAKQARINDQLREEIMYDGLTQIYNHTGLFDSLNQKIEKYKNKELDKLYMVVLDIDYFKHVNDDFGHEAGNQVLQRLGSLMRGIESDRVIPARYGGEEFALIFFDIDKKEMMKYLRQLHEEFAQQQYVGINRQITFSAGVGEYEPQMTDRQLFEKADKALYQAKNEGRNRIVTAA